MPVKYIKEVLRLNLPKDEYALFGSACLAVRGLRENKDIDVLVKDELWKKLLRKYKANEKGAIKIRNVEIAYGSSNPWRDAPVDEMIDDADIFRGIRYVKLEYILAWKKKRKNAKDIKDIRLIENYLRRNKK